MYFQRLQIQLRAYAYILVCCTLGLSAIHVVAADAGQEFTFAMRLMERGDQELAKETLTQFLTRFPNDRRVADTHYYLAVMAHQSNDLVAADAHLAKIRNPQHITDSAIRLLRGQVMLKRNDAGGAIKILEAIQPNQLDDDATRALWHYLLGAAYSGSGNPAGAAQQFLEASESDTPMRGQALVELGKARISLNQATAAIEAINEALNYDLPANVRAEALTTAGDLSYSLKQYPQAADYYKQVIERHQASDYFGLGLTGSIRAQYAAGLYDGAIAQFNATSTSIPKDHMPDALYLVGASLMQKGDFANASKRFVEFYTVAAPKHPQGKEVAYLYSVCLYQTDIEEFERWVAALESELTTMPRGDELQYMRAQAALKRQKPEDAARLLTPLIDRDTEYAKRSLLQRAAIYDFLKKTDLAAADYVAYADTYGDDPAAANASRRAIDIAFRAGNYERVVTSAEKWLKQEKLPADQKYAVQLLQAEALIQLDKRAEALAVLDVIMASKPPAEVAAQANYRRGVLLSAANPGDIAAINALQAAADGPLSQSQKISAFALIARQHYLAGREKQALEMYEKLRTLQSVEKFEPAIAIWVGRGLFDAGNHEAALQWLKPVTEQNNVDEAALSQALFYTGEAQRHAGQNEQAIESYRRLIATSRAFNDRARLGLAESLTATGHTEEALAEYDGLMNAQASEVAATALLKSAQARLAIADQIEPSDSEAAGRERTEARRRLSRIAILHDVPELDYTVGLANILLGRLIGSDDRTRARLAFEAVAGRSPQSVWKNTAEAEITLLDGQLGAAAVLLRKVYRESENDKIKAYAVARLDDIGEKP